MPSLKIKGQQHLQGETFGNHNRVILLTQRDFGPESVVMHVIPSMFSKLLVGTKKNIKEQLYGLIEVRLHFDMPREAISEFGHQ